MGSFRFNRINVCVCGSAAFEKKKKPLSLSEATVKMTCPFLERHNCANVTSSLCWSLFRRFQAKFNVKAGM